MSTKCQGNRETVAPLPRSQGVERLWSPYQKDLGETLFPQGFGSGSFISSPECCFLAMMSPHGAGPQAEGKT